MDNEPIFVVVEKAELDAIRNISQTIDSQYSPYNNGTDVHNWMEIKAGIKSLSKLIPTSNNIEMAKAVEYDSKFEGGARVLVELPNSPNEIVEPKLVEGNVVSQTLDTVFDFVEESIEEIPEPIIVNSTATTKTNTTQPVETKQEVKPVKKEGFEWELPNESKDSIGENDSSDEIDDVSFNFPDNDEDDEDVNSTLF